MQLRLESNLRLIVFVLLLNVQCATLYGQFMNKEVEASIKVNNNSEFIEFVALSENKTPLSLALEYDFIIYTTKADGTVKKDNDRRRYTTVPGEKKILQTLSISDSETNKVVIVLAIYNKDGDPIGQDRIELPNGGKSDLKNLQGVRVVKRSSLDQAAPQDGIKLEGLIINKSLTKAGRDFHRYFYLEYFGKDIKSEKNIFIKEIPGRQRRTLISVKVGDRLVWQFFAQPKKEYLKQMAQIAITRTILQLQAFERQRDTFIQY